jgi:UDP-N-acetyl-2-amino-2-deoxyglucuronate dehydrogenase
MGILGCGRISSNHFNSIEAHSDEIELVAVCDADPEVLARTVADQGVQGHDRLEDMLETHELDLV